MSRRSYIRIEKVRNKKSMYKHFYLNALLFFILYSLFYLVY